MATKIDSRQWIQKAELSRVTGSTNSEGDNILEAIDGELTPPLELKASTTPDLIVNIGAISTTNPETGLTKTIPPISNLLPVFAGGTVTFPAASGGSITLSAGYIYPNYL